jgi:hypothetical protein
MTIENYQKGVKTAVLVVYLILLLYLEPPLEIFTNDMVEC